MSLFQVWRFRCQCVYVDAPTRRVVHCPAVRQASSRTKRPRSASARDGLQTRLVSSDALPQKDSHRNTEIAAVGHGSALEEWHRRSSCLQAPSGVTEAARPLKRVDGSRWGFMCGSAAPHPCFCARTPESGSDVIHHPHLHAPIPLTCTLHFHSRTCIVSEDTICGLGKETLTPLL